MTDGRFLHYRWWTGTVLIPDRLRFVPYEISFALFGGFENRPCVQMIGYGIISPVKREVINGGTLHIGIASLGVGLAVGRRIL